MHAVRPPWLDVPFDVPFDVPHGSDELSRLRGMTPSERLALFVEACELARAILQHRPDAAEVLARRVPLSEEADATWLRLCAEGRRARAA